MRQWEAVLREVANVRLKKGQVPVLFGDPDRVGWNTPVYRELRVVEANAAVVLWRIVGRDLIGEQRIRLKGEEGMRKSDRNEELVAVFRAKLDRHMLAEAGGARSQIDDHIEDGSRHDADEFRLAERLLLEMQTAQGVHRLGKREIVLNEVDRDARVG